MWSQATLVETAQRGVARRTPGRVVALAFVLAISVPALVHAAHSNDDFANATVIPSIPYTNTVDTSTATVETGEPRCEDLSDRLPGGVGPMTKTVWYRFTAPVDATFVADTAGSNFDTMLAVYTLTYDALLLRSGRCVDDGAGGYQEKMYFDGTAGTTYYIQAGGWRGASGALQFALRQEEIPCLVSGPLTLRPISC